jgi:urea transporter
MSANQTETEKNSLRAALEAILNAYAIVFFCRQARLGAALLAATFLAPSFGLFGLAGVLTAFVAARWLGFGDAGIRNGELLYNSLLVSLGLAYLNTNHAFSPTLLVLLLPALSLAAMFLSAALNHTLRSVLGLSALSMPFVILTIGMYLLVYARTATPVIGICPTCLIPEPSFLPPIVAEFFQSFGAVFFLPLTPVGIVVFLALACHSRLMLLLGAVGFAAGSAFLQLTHLHASAFGIGWLGTNFVFCGIALGGIYFVPSRGALLMAIVGPALCTLAAVGMRAALRTYNIPPLSLPFILVVFCAVCALRRRERFQAIFENPYAELTPEGIVRRFMSVRRRFPDSHLPALFLPFTETRVVTQGFNGSITHTGPWSNALDFEILDERGEALPPQRFALEDSYTFGTPILAPCDGTVIGVVSHVADNALGSHNLKENWGNFVVLLTDLGAHVALCHFKQHGICVVVNQRVWRGQLLGHCGNSGRSPLPHLHLQVQAGAWPGAATLPFRVRQFISIDPGAKRSFHLLGVPLENMRIAPLIDDREVAACFEAGLGTRIRFRIESAGRPIGWETIETSSPAWGQVSFRSLERGTTLRASMLDSVFIADELEGRAGMLSMLRIGLSAAPFSRDRGIHWRDFFDPRPLRGSLSGWAADLLEPFIGVGFVGLQFHFADSSNPDELIVVTELGAGNSRLPRQIETKLSRELGLLELTVVKPSGNVRFVPETWERLTDVR